MRSSPRLNAASLDSLSDFLKRIESDIPSSSFRIVPSSFDPDAPDLAAIPLPADYAWDSCKAMLQHFGSSGVMMRLPLFWQTESLLHAACRAADTYIFVNDAANMPIGALAIKLGEVDTVVTDRHDAMLFGSYLGDKGLRFPEHWIVISEAEEAALGAPVIGERGVAHEVHLFPGLPVLQQCPDLADTNAGLFHFSDSITPHYGRDGRCTVSFLFESPLSQYRHPLPFRIQENGLCSCGKQRLRVIN